MNNPPAANNEALIKQLTKDVMKAQLRFPLGNNYKYDAATQQMYKYDYSGRRQGIYNMSDNRYYAINKLAEYGQELTQVMFNKVCSDLSKSYSIGHKNNVSCDFYKYYVKPAITLLFTKFEPTEKQYARLCKTPYGQIVCDTYWARVLESRGIVDFLDKHADILVQNDMYFLKYIKKENFSYKHIKLISKNINNSDISGDIIKFAKEYPPLKNSIIASLYITKMSHMVNYGSAVNILKKLKNNGFTITRKFFVKLATFTLQSSNTFYSCHDGRLKCKVNAKINHITNLYDYILNILDKKDLKKETLDEFSNIMFSSFKSTPCVNYFIAYHICYLLKKGYKFTKEQLDSVPMTIYQTCILQYIKHLDIRNTAGCNTPYEIIMKMCGHQMDGDMLAKVYEHWVVPIEKMTKHYVNFVPDKRFLKIACGKTLVEAQDVLAYKIMPDSECAVAAIKNKNDSRILELLKIAGFSITQEHLYQAVREGGVLNDLEKYDLQCDEELFKVCHENFPLSKFPYKLNKFLGMEKKIELYEKLNQKTIPTIADLDIFIEENNLEYDIICLEVLFKNRKKKLTVDQNAANAIALQLLNMDIKVRPYTLICFLETGYSREVKEKLIKKFENLKN